MLGREKERLLREGGSGEVESKRERERLLREGEREVSEREGMELCVRESNEPITCSR